jgi:hypothetical protein
MTDSDMTAIVLTGVGATMIADLWTLARRRMFGVPLPDFALVGRWVAHMVRGRFRHDSMAAAGKVRFESVTGWSVHYIIGIAFACLLPLIWSLEWFRHPTWGPAVIVGIGTVVAPFFVMQPAMGAGIAASRTARPRAARFHSLVLHAMFGLGLYLAGVAVSSVAYL